MIELMNGRSYTRRLFRQDDGSCLSRCHAGHVHFKDEVTGLFVPVNFGLVDAGQHWVMTQASYRLTIAKSFGAANLIQFENRFEGAAHTVQYDPRQVVWVENRSFNAAVAVIATDGLAANQRNVAGGLVGQTIRYTDAFGPGLHFVIDLKRSGFTKEIVIDSAAALGTPPSTSAHVALLIRYDDGGLTVSDELDGSQWNGTSLFERSGRFSLRDTLGRKSFIAPAYAVDALERRHALPVAFVQRQSALWQVKILPRHILNQALYPLRADTTTQFYAGAGDGYSRFSGGVWATVHSALTGNSTDATATTSRVNSSFVGAAFFIIRSFFPIDTSAIPDAATINAATLYVMYGSTFGDDDNDGDDFIVVVGPTSQASTSTLANADFDQCGAITNPTEVSARVDLGVISQSTSAYQAFPLTSLTPVSKTGFTLLGMREGHDVIDSAVSSSVDPTNNRWFWCTSEDASGTKDPYLEVAYSTPSRPLFRSPLRFFQKR